MMSSSASHLCLALPPKSLPTFSSLRNLCQALTIYIPRSFSSPSVIYFILPEARLPLTCPSTVKSWWGHQVLERPHIAMVCPSFSPPLAASRPFSTWTLTNHAVPYNASVDLSDLVCSSKVASELSLGPNASLMYCMEYLANHLHWLHAKLKQFKDYYILFDFPGQIELYTHNECIRKVVQGYFCGMDIVSLL